MTNVIDAPVGETQNTLTITGVYRKYRDWKEKSRILWRSECCVCRREMIVVPAHFRDGREHCLCSKPKAKRRRVTNAD